MWLSILEKLTLKLEDALLYHWQFLCPVKGNWEFADAQLFHSPEDIFVNECLAAVFTVSINDIVSLGVTNCKDL